MSEWQPIETAPAGVDILVYGEGLITDGVGWVPALDCVVAWGDLVRYADGDRIEFKCGICDEGSADTEGYSSPYQQVIWPTHWMPLPSPPTNLTGGK